MSTVTIHSDSTVSVGTTITGYCVRQEAAGTKVLAWHNNGHPAPRDMGLEVTMPSARYVLSTAAGRLTFDTDFLAAWHSAVRPPIPQHPPHPAQ